MQSRAYRLCSLAYHLPQISSPRIGRKEDWHWKSLATHFEQLEWRLVVPQTHLTIELHLSSSIIASYVTRTLTRLLGAGGHIHIEVILTVSQGHRHTPNFVVHIF